MKKVREVRKHSNYCHSAKDDVDLPKILQEILDKDAYKADYESITKILLFEDVKYEDIKTSLQELFNKIFTFFS